MKYQAKMISNAKVIQQLEFDADTPIDAYAIANDGIDPLSGQWVEIRRAPEPPPRIDPEKLAPKTDAQREYKSTDQGDAPKDLRTDAV